MKVIHPDEQAGASGKPGSQFTGVVHPFVTMPSTDGVAVNTVTFTPCSRTFWHHHERGQILLVLAGRGLIQAEGGPVRELRAGDVVWAPPGERHWHGGGPDSVMVHVAISLGQTSWAGEVSDGEYGAPIDEGESHAP